MRLKVDHFLCRIKSSAFAIIAHPCNRQTVMEMSRECAEMNVKCCLSHSIKLQGAHITCTN